MKLSQYGDRLGFDGRELHCGDCFQVKDPHTNTWLDVRIELSGGEWYLVGLPAALRNRSLLELEARSYP